MAVPEQNIQNDAETQRTEQFARKQKWKEQPGNRYTAEELHRMADAFGPFTIETSKTDGNVYRLTVALPNIYDWDRFRAALQTLAERFPDNFPLWVLVGGGACWFYRRSLERTTDPDFRVPSFTAKEEDVWLSKDVDFVGITRAEAAELFNAPVKAETRTITFQGLEVDFVEMGLHMTEEAVAASARVVHTSNFDFYVADAAVLYDEKCALLAIKERPQDRLHRQVLAEFLKSEFCHQAEHPEALDVRGWLRRARIVKTADVRFFEEDPRLIQRLANAIRRLGPAHKALLHWAKHHLPGFTA